MLKNGANPKWLKKVQVDGEDGLAISGIDLQFLSLNQIKGNEEITKQLHSVTGSTKWDPFVTFKSLGDDNAGPSSSLLSENAGYVHKLKRK